MKKLILMLCLALAMTTACNKKQETTAPASEQAPVIEHAAPVAEQAAPAVEQEAPAAEQAAPASSHE